MNNVQHSCIILLSYNPILHLFIALTVNSQCEWVNFKPKNNHTTFPANLEKNLKNNFTVWNKLELIWNTRSKTIFRSNILSHLSSFISSSRGLVYFMCVFLKWRARLDLFNGGTMKISCLLCRVVSVLHLCRKGEKILGGGESNRVGLCH